MATKKKIIGAVALLALAIGITAYYRSPSSHQQMVEILQTLRKRNLNTENPFSPEVKWVYIDSMLKRPGNEKNLYLLNLRASLALRSGREDADASCWLLPD